MEELNEPAAADFSKLEERVTASMGARHRGKSVLLSNPQMHAAERIMKAITSQAAQIGTMVHDEVVLSMDEGQYMTWPQVERGKQPWQKGYFPKQGKPAVMPPRLVAGWDARTTNDARHEYHRRGSSLVVRGTPFMGWTVLRESWMADDQFLSHFPKLNTALVWAALQQANEVEPDNRSFSERNGFGPPSTVTGRAVGKTQALKMREGFRANWPELAELGAYKDLARYCNDDVELSKP